MTESLEKPDYTQYVKTAETQEEDAIDKVVALFEPGGRRSSQNRKKKEQEVVSV